MKLLFNLSLTSLFLSINTLALGSPSIIKATITDNGSIKTSAETDFSKELKKIKSLRKGNSNTLLGGSSTGGGSDLSEKFKSLGHIYATYLKDISLRERSLYDISVTTEELNEVVKKYSDRIIELNKSHNFIIYDDNGREVAIVVKGRIIENGASKQAYHAASVFEKHIKKVIYISVDWRSSASAVPLKEYLRALGKSNEIAAILNYSRAFEDPTVTLSKEWIRKQMRLPHESAQLFVKIDKVSSSHLSDKRREDLKREYLETEGSTRHFHTYVKSYLERKNRIAALNYINRMCEKSYETAEFRQEGYLFTEVADYKFEKESCRYNKSLKLKCELSWNITCKYQLSIDLYEKLKSHSKAIKL